MILNPRKYQSFNELFAEFLDCTKDENGRFIFPNGAKMALNMHFHDRWDWLMMIVEKMSKDVSIALGSGGFVQIIDLIRDDLADDNITSNEEKTLILNVYNACYQYIKKVKNEEAAKNSPDSTQQTEA
jgi:hypothetical protein